MKGSANCKIEIKNNRFVIAGISIGLPGGLYLTTHPSYESENILVFSDKEQTFYIEVQAEENDDSLENSLRNEMQQNRYTVLTDITPMSLNELNGCYAIYANSENEYYDARIQKPQAAKQHLEILITAEKGAREIQSILSLTEVTGLLNNISSVSTT